MIAGLYGQVPLMVHKPLTQFGFSVSTKFLKLGLTVKDVRSVAAMGIVRQPTWLGPASRQLMLGARVALMNLPNVAGNQWQLFQRLSAATDGHFPGICAGCVVANGPRK